MNLTQKDARWQMCTHRNYVRKRVWGWEECVSFDIRMVTKNNGREAERERNERAKELNNSKRSDGVDSDQQKKDDRGGGGNGAKGKRRRGWRQRKRKMKQAVGAKEAKGKKRRKEEEEGVEVNTDAR